MSGRRMLVTLLASALLLVPMTASGTPPADGPASRGAGAAGPPTTAALLPSPSMLTNGCRVNQRGVPGCGAYLGMAYGGNDDPARLERQIGGLGVRRTYFRHNQVLAAVRIARQDIAAGRLPWISFKLPYAWWRMARGDGDAWARRAARLLSWVDGPVWVAFHHEPEGDGTILNWRRTQERLAPMVRGTAPNVAYTVILTGWHQLYGDRRFALWRIWPRNVRVDVAGFDIYNAHGLIKRGKLLGPTDMDEDYFARISRWAERMNVHWGLAETGYTDYAARRDPDWIDQTHHDLVRRGGVAMAYFNSKLNSIGSWDLDMPAKRSAFADALVDAPRLPAS